MKKLFLLIFFVVFLSVTSFPTVLSTQYLLKEGESIVFNGRIVKLEGVGNSVVVVVSVDGLSEVIDLGETKIFNGLEIEVVDINYYPKEQQVSSASLDMRYLLKQGESTKLTIVGIEYTVKVDDVASSSTGVVTVSSIKKTHTKSVTLGGTYNIGGLIVYVSDIFYYPGKEQVSSMRLTLYSPEKECIDSDGGFNIYEHGIAKGIHDGDAERIEREYFDYCLSYHGGPKDGILSESYCENGLVYTKDVYCDYGCVGGPFEGKCACIKGDINGDGKVNILDLYQIASAFNSYPEHKKWNPKADFNSDGKININDIFIVAKNFGKVCSPTETIPITTTTVPPSTFTGRAVLIRTFDLILTLTALIILVSIFGAFKFSEKIKR